jgi:hypothetical protein
MARRSFCVKLVVDILDFGIQDDAHLRDETDKSEDEEEGVPFGAWLVVRDGTELPKS